MIGSYTEDEPINASFIKSNDIKLRVTTGTQVERSHRISYLSYMSNTVPFFKQHKTVTILLRIRVKGHFVMFNTRHHESHYITVLDNPPSSTPFLTRSFNLSHFALAYGIISIENSTANHIERLSDHNPHDWPPVTKDTAPEVAFPGMPNTV